ncbi:MAG: hypothetical protein NT096_13815 [Proteobacteria bacterium]|nr:hypothetical protein [Pseudomonadota bacterium]
MTDLPTWAGKSKFSYIGSVKEGTYITYGRGFSCKVSAKQYSALIDHFRGKTVNIGTSRDNPPKGSVGEWLQKNVIKTAIASYVGSILIAEGYAERGYRGEIKFF